MYLNRRHTQLCISDDFVMRDMMMKTCDLCVSAVCFSRSVTALIIVSMSLNIAYHLLYVMHLKLDVIIGES
jgi:hypothetical protein